MKKITNIEHALQLFEEVTALRAQAIEMGDYKTNNKACNQATKVVSYLKEHKALSRLEKFLNHRLVGPRLDSATCLLPIMPDESIRILTEIGKHVGANGATANMALEEWRKGGLLHIRALYEKS